MKTENNNDTDELTTEEEYDFNTDIIDLNEEFEPTPSTTTKKHKKNDNDFDFDDEDDCCWGSGKNEMQKYSLNIEWRNYYWENYEKDTTFNDSFAEYMKLQGWTEECEGTAFFIKWMTIEDARKISEQVLSHHVIQNVNSEKSVDEILA